MRKIYFKEWYISEHAKKAKNLLARPIVMGRNRNGPPPRFLAPQWPTMVLRMVGVGSRLPLCVKYSKV